MPRFVILEHDHPVLHWDLMLEAGEKLQTWRLAQPPAVGESVAALALGDHRAIYLDYEGPVSGNRGTVRRFDAGAFSELPESSPEARVLILEGQRVRGRLCLERVEGDNWRVSMSA